MNRKENHSPQSEISQTLVEFLEVAITSIVFLKGIYPIGAFERRRYMNLVVHSARHPELNHYIHNSLNALLPYIQQGMVERVAVIFFNNDKVPLERFMFKINVSQSYEGTIEDVNLESSLRSFLIKLSQSEPVSKSTISQDKWKRTQTLMWQQLPLITPVKSLNIDPMSVQLYVEHPSLLEN
ncbi:DNA polymerase zeta processivity subunit isoform X2 [Rutidosis leptorrhynchoides]|uniref:DNA polymerase zeta processivity subunit isoform X2 n=1 Tax=Rutidosis leptorrhynchoides TaxID=125765 RepID=UPI003A9A104F